eukprot:13094525-Alexandrium_andersonii.AAC.1
MKANDKTISMMTRRQDKETTRRQDEASEEDEREDRDRDRLRGAEMPWQGRFAALYGHARQRSSG